jgi:hypothetical protein
MNKQLMKLLKNDWVLKVVSVVYLVSALSMLLKRKISCLLTLVVVSLIARYFTKNMALVLLAGLVATLVMDNLSHNVVENLENKVDNEEEEKENEDSLELEEGLTDPSNDSEEEQDEKEEMSNLSPASLNDKSMEVTNKIDKVGKLDHAASVEAAYDNLDKILSSSALQNMSKDTARLAEKQENLMKQLKGFGPMMTQAENMLKSLGDFDLNKLLKKN